MKPNDYHVTEMTRATLAQLREQAGLTQGQLADRLSFTPSRLSRLESGETDLNGEDAEQIALKIGTPKAKAFAEYLKQDWRITERPGFNHPNICDLWMAEGALQKLENLERDPNLKNAFLQQIKLCRAALERSARELRATEHPIVLIGPPEVGKTSTLCELTKLRREAEGLNNQMALQTGGGRVTICETHVRNGSDYTISVEACSVEEVQQFVGEFCDDLLRETKDGNDQAVEAGGGVSAEVERAIRNMSGLTVRRPKGEDGQMRREDLAANLAKAFPNKEDLLVQILTRMDLPRRTQTSITLPRNSTISGLDWISKAAAEINYGRHPDFSLPRRVEISVPTRLLGSEDFDIRLIDTRGVDEPSAPRRDLQAYLDDPRCIPVLCSKFGDAPTGATLSVIERAIKGGLKDALLNRGMLLVLPRNGDDTSVRDSTTGEWVADSDEGRAIKAEHIRTTLLHQGCQNLPVQYLNVSSPEDGNSLRDALVAKVQQLRRRESENIANLSATIGRLISNHKVEETRAVFDAATRSLRIWLKENRELPPMKSDARDALLKEMEGLRYVASLRASVNRGGNWSQFNYWLGLGFGVRVDTFARTSGQLNALKVLISAALLDPNFMPAHDFLRLFLSEVERTMTEFYEWAQDLGESAFKAQLGGDHKYWSQCQDRWGMGPGYKADIRTWTKSWFDVESRKERNQFIDAEIQGRWKLLLEELDNNLSSGGPKDLT